MSVVAEIKVGKRRIIEFFLYPVLSICMKALASVKAQVGELFLRFSAGLFS